MVDPFRPAFHLTDRDQFINDPNGPVWFDGEYHVFYQRGPRAKSWGHAVSDDLVRWKLLPPALEPDELGDIWSGSCAVDRHNSCGLVPDGPGLVALFTHHHDRTQIQSLAYSRDRGRTWVKYAGNPVLASPGNPDFRDPKVFWHAPSGRWAMVLATGHHVTFYASPDLVHWQQTGTFGLGHGMHTGVWECPDLFELPVEGRPGEKRWVLLVSTVAPEVFAAGSAGGPTGVQYFVGHFDGQTFVNDNPPQTVLPAVQGPDEYATTSFFGMPDGRPVAIGWLSNWQYAHKLPTQPWQNLMSLPRELRLVPTPAGLRLAQLPVRELASLRFPVTLTDGPRSIKPGAPCTLAASGGDRMEIAVELHPADAKRVGLRLRAGAGHHTDLTYDVPTGILELDRRQSGLTDFSPAFPLPTRVPLTLPAGVLRLRVIIDRCSIEVFANDGIVYLPALIFAPQDATGIQLLAEGGEPRLSALNLWALASEEGVIAWP